MFELYNYKRLKEEGDKALKRGEFDEAIRHYLAATEIEIRDEETRNLRASTYINLATCYQKMQRYRDMEEAAESAYICAKDGTPIKVMACENWALALCGQRKLDQAIGIYCKIIKESNVVKVYKQLAEICEIKNMYTPAMYYYEEAVKKGSKKASRSIVKLYENGLVPIKDYVKAIQYYYRAYCEGFYQARNFLESLL